jgi:demethylspheroidene O-methyltransferase
VIISEPMLGSRFGDTYFALYCMAMRTGHARRAEDISQLLREAGFKSVRVCKPRRAFVTTVIEAVN